MIGTESCKTNKYYNLASGGCTDALIDINH